MRLTEKSRVTSKHVRNDLGIGPRSEVDLKSTRRAQGSPSRRSTRRKGSAWCVCSRKRLPRSGLTTHEIMEMTRGPFDDVDPR